MEEYHLSNDQLQVRFIRQGACLTYLGKDYNYLLRYHNLSDYQTNDLYLSTIVGRNAGRTSPCYYVDHLGKQVALDANEGSDVHLHGGHQSMKLVLWDLVELTPTEAKLSLTDQASECYAPMTFTLTYRLEENRLITTIEGHADEPTVVNLTNHAFFNLNESKADPITNHWLKLAPAQLQLFNQSGVATGELDAMLTSPYKVYNCTQPTRIESMMKAENPMAERTGGGLDFAYLFQENTDMEPKVELFSADHQRGIRIFSNQESCVIYTMNQTNGEIINDGIQAEPYAGITFEMQRLPNYLHHFDTDVPRLESDYLYQVTYEII